MILRRLFTAALVAGAVAGIFAASGHLWLLQSLLEAAEAIAEDSHAHGDHSHITRYALTYGANIISFCGFGLVLGALMEWHNPKPTLPIPLIGLLWGGLGYFVVILTPTLGLSPNLPGMAVAEVEIRQIWWLAAVLCASASVWVAVLAPLPKWRIAIAVVIFLLPHIYGAPATDEVSNIPAGWSALFATRSLGISFIAWMILGSVTARVLYKDSQ